MRSIFLCLSMCALFFATSCESKEHEKEKESKFLVTSAARMDTSLAVDYVSQVHAISHIELRAQERGYLENIYVDEGQFVKKGQLLFQIMPKLYEAELKRAEAEANFAEIEYLNAKQLAESNVIAQTELAMANAKWEKAKAELNMAMVHLEFTQIRAPFDGIIDRFHVRLGSLIEEGDLLTNLSDNSEMWVYFNVPEAEYLDYKANATSTEDYKVNLIMANNKPFEFEGVVKTIEADFNNETGNIAFRATFPNPKGLLRHGETGKVLIKRPLENALIIPQKATFEVLDKRYVYVLDEHNSLKSREITVAAEMPHLYAIESGLQESDKILLDGLRLVRENDEIEYEFVEPLKALGSLKLYAE